jgi:hypothetical protein
MYQTTAHAIRRSFLLVLLAALSGVLFVTNPAHAATIRDTIVSRATAQLGETGCSGNNGNGYYNSCGINWCAEFARWVWATSGVPDVAGLNSWAQSFKAYGQERGLYHARGSGYTPQPGDAVVFDWDHSSGDDHPIDHVAIVTSVSGSTVNTIGGNQGSGSVTQTVVSRASYALSNGDIDGYVEPAVVSGLVSIYGVLGDGRMTFTHIDAASGRRTHGAVISSANLGFVPKAMATLNFNTVLVTSPAGELYRVDVITNSNSLVFNPPVYLGSGWTQELLAYDGNGHLFGIGNGRLRRYNVTASKPASGDITGNTLIDNGFALKTLTTTGPDWILGTTSGGELLSYRIRGAGDWDRYQLRASTWQVFDAMLSPGGGVYYGHRSSGSMVWYVDHNPYDGSGSDLGSATTVDTGGWTQVLLSAQPRTVG